MKIIYIADPEILRIPIIENHEPLIDLKHQSELAYGPPPETPLTKNDYTKLRKTVVEKLCRAQKSLPSGWRFRVYEGFRSLTVQQQSFDEEYARTQKRYSEKTHTEIFREATRLISPVENLDGSKNIPPHNTGAAVDVEIIDHEGKLIDMGMAIADWPNVNPELCLTHCDTLTLTARENRQLLLDIMQQENFVNYPTEWWHFSYGDRYWAYHKNKSHALYDSLDLIK